MAALAQNVIRIGDEAPDFKAESQLGTIEFHKAIDKKWAILFSHPGDYTPVCTTELGRVAQLKDEWAKRNTVVFGLSVDPLDKHEGWIKDINETQKCHVEYPIIADPDRHISKLYGMLDQTKADQAGLPLTVRSLFIIGADKKVKLIITYPASTGRNFDEVLRVLDSLQLTAVHKVATPVDWKRGQDTVVLPAVSDEEARKLFPKGFTAIKPYLRITPDPSVGK